MKKNKVILIIFALLFGFGIGYYVKYCSVVNEGWQTFDSKKWKPYEQGVQGENFRKKMVFNLVHNKLKFRNNGSKFSEVVKLIGKPTILEDGKPFGSFMIIEEIEEKYGWNIDPEGGTNLKLFFDKDSILQHWRIEEFWYEP